MVALRSIETRTPGEQHRPCLFLLLEGGLGFSDMLESTREAGVRVLEPDTDVRGVDLLFADSQCAADERAKVERFDALRVHSNNTRLIRRKNEQGWFIVGEEDAESDDHGDLADDTPERRLRALLLRPRKVAPLPA